MPLIPSPSKQRRRLHSRAALVLFAAFSGALLLPAPAGAVLLWRRGGKQAGSQTVVAAGRSPTPVAATSGLAGAAASAMDAPERLPTPSTIANYAHELRLLKPAHDELTAASGNRESSLALVEYGNVLARLSRDGAAARAYADALVLDPHLQSAWNNLGSLLRRRGELELASSLFRLVLSEDPEAGLAWFNLAMALDSLRDWDGSDEAYVLALTYSPELWVPTRNPLIVGNHRAQQALHHRYLARNGRGSIYLDDAR